MRQFLALLMLTNLAWAEGFESVPYFPPDHWIVVNADAYDAYWVPTQAIAHSGTRAASCGADFNSQNDDYLIAPRVMPRVDANDTVAAFWACAITASPCSVEVLVSTAAIPTPSSFVRAACVPLSQAWQHHTASLAAFDSTNLWVAFRVRQLSAGQRVVLDDIALPATTARPVLCNGRLRTRGDPVQQRLLAWGTHEEIGFAHGFLLAEQCIANMTRFVVGSTGYHWWTPSQYESQVLPFFRAYFSIPPSYQEEAEGLLAGMQAKGASLYHPALGRTVTVEDILCANALGDFQGFNCSSNSGWGESTAADDTLEGGVVIGRNFEFKTGQDATLGHTSLVIATDPSEVGEQRTASITFAGYFGCTSVVNGHGVGAFIDNGNYASVGSIGPGSLIPFGFSLRTAVQDAGTLEVFDVASRIDQSTSRYAYDVHVVAPFDDAHPTPAAILELNNLADSLRFAADNSLAPAISSSHNLVVTNHHRVLYPPVYCDRYASMACSLNANTVIDTQRALRIQDSVAWWVNSYLAGTLHTIAVRPNVLVEHPSWPCIVVSYANRFGGAHTRPRHAYSWDELFWRDTQSPATIVDLTIAPVGADLHLSWSDPGDDVGVTGYRIYRSGCAYFEPDLSSLAASTVLPQWTDAGAAQGTTGVCYRITAQDAALNEAAPSSPAGKTGFEISLP